MPERPVNDVSVPAVCTRCQADARLHTVRKEHFCSDCFTNYISTKIVKRMDSFKVRSPTDSPKRILLSLSLGVSSLAVLHVLDRQLLGQTQKTGRVGYELYVLCIDDSLIVGAESGLEDDQSPWKKVQQLYPRHRFYRRSLSDALALFPNEYLSSMRGCSTQTASSTHSLQALVSSLPSPTSRTDFLLSLQRRLLPHVARELSCTSIALGHSSTKLAELVLAESSKGRGAALSLLVGDAAELEGVRCIFPARELMRNEIEGWAKEVVPSLAALSIAANKNSGSITTPVSSKGTTIDQLMTQYFAGVEANYPSIVANVVRTTTRLAVADAMEDDRVCQLCALPIKKGMEGLSGWGGDQAAIVTSLESGEEQGRGPLIDTQNIQLCYGCARTVEDPKKLNKISSG
jgi:cytoplasmic tRNA 2-thiolation protein 2